MEYFVVCSDHDIPYLEAFYAIGCMDGDREYLYNKIRENPKFCRVQRNISYDYFLKPSVRTVVYILQKEIMY
jgi:hypothetical protein